MSSHQMYVRKHFKDDEKRQKKLRIVKSQKIFGDVLLDDEDEQFIVHLSKMNPNLIFEKTLKRNNGEWYLTVKNFRQTFDLTKFTKDLFVRNNFNNCLVHFYQGEDTKLKIESTFFIGQKKHDNEKLIGSKINFEKYSKGNVELKNTEQLVKSNFSEKNIQMLKELCFMFDRVFVNDFFKKKVIYKVTIPKINQLGINIEIEDSCDIIDPSKLIEVINFWALKESLQYTKKFKLFKVYLRKQSIIIRFLLNISRKKMENNDFKLRKS